MVRGGRVAAVRGGRWFVVVGVVATMALGGCSAGSESGSGAVTMTMPTVNVADQARAAERWTEMMAVADAPTGWYSFETGSGDIGMASDVVYDVPARTYDSKVSVSGGVFRSVVRPGGLVMLLPDGTGTCRWSKASDVGADASSLVDDSTMGPEPATILGEIDEPNPTMVGATVVWTATTPGLLGFKSNSSIAKLTDEQRDEVNAIRNKVVIRFEPERDHVEIAIDLTPAFRKLIEVSSGVSQAEIDQVVQGDRGFVTITYTQDSSPAPVREPVPTSLPAPGTCPV
jgi:hypothetical protein